MNVATDPPDAWNSVRSRASQTTGPGRVNNRVELNQDEGDGEHDAGQRHHAGGDTREIGLGRRDGKIKAVGKVPCFEPRPM